MKFCTEICDEIVGYIKKGSTQKDAAIMSGINEVTFYDWIKDGKRDIASGIESQKSKFFKSVKKAEKSWKAANQAIIQKAALKHWQAAAWLLERKCPDEYALRNRHEITGKEGKEIRIVTIPAMEKIMKAEDPD